MTRTPVATRGPIARLERAIGAAGLLCAAVVIAATVAHALQLRGAIQAAAEGRLLTVARILTKEVNRTLLQTRGLFDQVDEVVRAEGTRSGPALDALLEGMPRQQSLLREIAVVDGSGRIVASSDRRHVGLDVSGYDFARTPRSMRIHVGVPKAGRSFSSDAARREGPAFAHTGFVTVARTASADADGLLVVAVLGADSLVGDLKFVSSADEDVLALYRYDGQLLATSDPAATRRGTPHPIFASFLPERESGGFADASGDGGAWIGHFDTTPDFPVVVEVRRPQAEVTARWERELTPPALILAVTLAALWLFTRTTAGALRRRALSEEQAATQERRLRNILDTAADGIVTIDGRAVIREYNRAAESIFGVDAADALGRPLSKLLPADEAALHAPAVEALLAGGAGGTGSERGHRIRTRRLDGRAIELAVSVSEVRDGAERLITGIVHDVTDVAQAEERFRTLFLRSSEPHLLFDAQGLLIDCNDAAAALLRADRREALHGSRLLALAAPVQPGGPAAAVLGSAREAARRDGTHRLVWTARAVEGSELPVEMTLTPVRLGDHDAMLVTWHDIAERQRHEQQLRGARDAAESAASAKSQFLAMMSHELRTPMTGIIGMIDLLQDASLQDEQRRFVDVLRASARSLLTVLDDVLDYSKIEAGRLHLEQIDFAPEAVAREVTELLSNSASQRGNVLALRWAEGSVPAVCGDPTRVRQLLFNLVGNAIKFTERGQVTVEGDARAMPDGRVALSFAITDTGVGIPADVLPTLFRPFQQADSSTTRRFGGTGLGLAICRHLAEAMDGEITARSREGTGSTFSFVLRLAPARGVPAAPSSREAAPRVGRLRLLVAEDTPTNRLLIVTRLRRAGHEVDVVENGRLAVEAVVAHDYDLVLMDMQMPELDGEGATRAIRALPGPRSRVPIVALTADALPEFRERYMTSGLDDYLTKPIDWSALDRVLARYAADAGATSPGDGPSTAPQVDPSPSPAHRPDEAPVAATRNDLGEDVWQAVAEVYWPQAEADLAACRAAVAAGDAAARRAAAHSLKGASASVGFESVAQAASALEHCDAQAAARAMRELDAAYGASHAAWCSAPLEAG